MWFSGRDRKCQMSVRMSVALATVDARVALMAFQSFGSFQMRLSRFLEVSSKAFQISVGRGVCFVTCKLHSVRMGLDGVGDIAFVEFCTFDAAKGCNGFLVIFIGCCGQGNAVR